ncbi:hypothetical protein ACSSV4_000620 [Roseovarius sp. MBR-154]|jgi:hypothetical protein
MNPEFVSLTVQVLMETEAAVMVADADPGDAVWIPRSQVGLQPAGQGLHHVTLPAWLARDKGLI